jgi:hypothetical protein
MGELESGETPREGGDREPQMEQSSRIQGNVSAISLEN